MNFFYTCSIYIKKLSNFFVSDVTYLSPYNMESCHILYFSLFWIIKVPWVQISSISLHCLLFCVYVLCKKCYIFAWTWYSWRNVYSVWPKPLDKHTIKKVAENIKTKKYLKVFTSQENKQYFVIRFYFINNQNLLISQSYL